MRIADLGCGWGFLGHLLLPSLPGGRVDGFDLEEEQVALGRERARLAGLRGRLTFEPGDAERLDAPDGRWDGAICQLLLRHCPRPASVLREMARVVRPGGFVAAVEPDLRLAAASRSDDLLDADPEHRARGAQVEELLARGSRALGAGDRTAGTHLGDWFREAGLEPVHASWTDARFRLEPGARSAAAAAYASGRFELPSEELADHRALLELLFRAGGGTPELFRRWDEREQELDRARRLRSLEHRLRAEESPALRLVVARVGL